MLKYLASTTEQLIAMMLVAGLAAACLETAYKNRGRRFMQISIIAGIICAAVMSFMKTTTNKVDTGMWNLRIFGTSLIAFILFLIATALGKKFKKAGELIAEISISVIVILLLTYYLPDVFGYPHQVLLTEKTMLSTAFMLKMMGVIFGIILTFLAGFSIYKATMRLGTGTAFLLAAIAIGINTAKEITTSFGILLAKRLIPSNHTLFVIAKHSSNYSEWFIFATIIAAVIVPVILWIRSFHVNEPYSNSAERRKIIAKWRNIRRWSTTSMIAMALAAVSITAVAAYANREVELSPIEDAPVEDGYVVVPFDRVNDGHLHRFGYTTENDVTIRFIVIQKPNSSAYGIGLDACDICGETGYYEKDGQVVCNLCDVVMNINTIGFKGGCNPIVIDYEIHDGKIFVPVDGLVEFESEFK